MLRIYTIIICFAAFVIAVDQWTKHLILQNFTQVGQSQEIFDWFSLTLVYNRGAAFGMLRNLPEQIRQVFFLILPLGVLCLFWWSIVRHLNPKERLIPVAMGLICGGALGNLVDRVVHGHVIDFIDWHYPSASSSCLPLFYAVPGTGACHWPVFNVADSAISVAAVLMIVEWFLKSRQSKTSST